MKRFWLGAVLTVLVLSGLWLAGIERQLAAPTPGSRWVFEAYALKTAAANRAAGPRVLVVAGSNAMFGIDTAQLEAFWRRPAINLAVNAGLGLRYILETSKRVARAGDVIVLPMEYALYLDDGSPNAQIIDYAIARDPDYWRSLAWWQRLDFAVGLTPERWLQGLRRLPDPAISSGVYGGHHLDARGDQTHTSAADQSPADLEAVRSARTWHYGARAARETGGWALLADYARWARKQGVCVVAVPAVLMYDKRYDQDPQEAAFYAGLPARLRATGITYLGLPRDFMYPPAWFFNTEHHLQDWARARHTARLLALFNHNPLGACP